MNKEIHFFRFFCHNLFYKEFIIKVGIGFILILIVLPFVNAGEIIKVKKDRFIFNLDDQGKVKRGTLVVITDSNGDKIMANVLKSTSKKALGKLQNVSQKEYLKVGLKATLKKDIVQEVTAEKKSKKKEDKQDEDESDNSNIGNGFFIEPFANYYHGKVSQEFTSTGTVIGDASFSGTAIGLNIGTLLGYKINRFYLSPLLSFSFGSHSSQVIKTNFNNTAGELVFEDFSFVKNSIGGYIGFQATEKNRVWLRASIISLATTPPQGQKTIYSGMSFGGGANWNISEKLIANISIIISKYSEEDGKTYPLDQTVGTETLSALEYKESNILIGLSYLFSFYK